MRFLSNTMQNGILELQKSRVQFVCPEAFICWNPCAHIHEEETVHCSQRYGPIAEGEQLTQ